MPCKSIFNCESKDFFHQSFEYPRFLAFAIVSLGDIKSDNLAIKYLQKCFFAMVILGMCQPLKLVFLGLKILKFVEFY